MRNSSRGLVLKPIPFTPGLPGLDVTEIPFKSIEQALAELPPVPEGLTPAERGTWAHEQVERVLTARKQRGNALVGALLGIALGAALCFIILADMEAREAEQRRAIDAQMEECLKAGRGAGVQNGVVTCYEVTR